MVNRIKKIVKNIMPEFMLDTFRNYKKYKLQKRLGINLVNRENIKFLGTDYSGYPIPMDLVGKDAICYCIGAGEEISFELLLCDEVQCDVFLFDPTPRSRLFVENLLEERGGVELSKEDNYKKSYFQISSHNLTFLPFAIWEKDAIVKMFAPQDNAHVSHSILNLQHTESFFWAQCYTLNTMMEKLGHTRIDLLKMNVEGAEYAILYSMLNLDISPKVLCVAFDEFHTKLDGNSDQRILECLQKLTAANYEPVYLDNSRMTFILAGYL